MTDIRSAFDAHRELAEHLPEAALAQMLSIPSNTIGQQFWCVIGARESYTRAIVEGRWAGFNNSLAYEDSGTKAVVLAALTSSAQGFQAAVEDVGWDSPRNSLLLKLLEHETQHQGQLIRYVYALPYRFPDSWVKRWSL